MVSIIRPRDSVWEFEGLAPSGVGNRSFRLPKSRLLQHFHETGNERMFREAALVPDVVGSPTAIFLGLGRSGQEEAFCYTGVPSGEFASNNELAASHFLQEVWKSSSSGTPVRGL